MKKKTKKVDRFFILLGQRLLDFFQSAGEMLLLFVEAVLLCKVVFRNLDKVLPQMGKIGADSLPIASLTAIFVGFVLALQTGVALQQFGQEEDLGAIVSIGMARELGPVLT
ncbi:MAG: ABC transporter permease, partial [Planctomycetes bacterium]|nr:ABC transporter permease [Planctomycetota bacterium]